MAFLYNVILHRNKKRTYFCTQQHDKSQTHNVKQRRPDTKEFTRYYSIYMKFKNRQINDDRITVTSGERYGQGGGMREPAGVLEMAHILIWVVVT